MRAMVTNDFKLVRYHPTGEVMLFDRANDPQELTNLAGNSAYMDVLSNMIKLLDGELVRTEMSRWRKT
jgi:arylsulfatase A-like enzyme